SLFTLLCLFHQAVYSQCSNRCLNFSATSPSDYVQCASSPLAASGSSDFTIEARFICQSTGINVRRIFSTGTNSPSSRIDLTEINGALRLYWQTVGGSTLQSPSLTNIRDNNWHHVALVRSGTSLILYLDGVQIFSDNTVTGSFSLSSFRIGGIFNTTTSTFFWQGSIDEVRVWTTARTQADINLTRNCKLACPQTNLKTYYDFDQGTPAGNNTGLTTLLDCSSQINATLNTFTLDGATSNWICSDSTFMNQVCGTTNCPATFTASSNNCGFVTFNNTTSGTFNYSWNFGDGATSTLTNPGHAYATGGTYTVCLTATSPNSSCTTCQSVSVTNQSVPPILNCDDTLQVECGATLPNYVPTVIWSSCSDAMTRTVDCVRLDGQPLTAPYFQGTTLIRCIAHDNIGNDTCIVAVNSTDTQPPNIVCNQSLTINLPPGGGGVFVSPIDLVPNAFDQCCPVNSLQYVINGNNQFTCADACQPRQLVVEVIDCNGHISFCQSTVTAIDNIAPSTTCPPSYGIPLSNGQCVANLTNTGTSTDNCGATIGQYVFSGATTGSGSGNGAGQPLNIGTTNVTYIATDACGNSSSCTFQVQVADTQSPTIMCPPSMVVQGDATNGGAQVNWPDPIASDNCSAVTLSSSYPNGSFFDCGNSVIIAYIATDASQNTATCTFSVTVNCDNGSSCQCAGFSNMALSQATGQGFAVQCGGSYNLPCPVDSSQYQLTYFFGCLPGATCSPENMSWELKHLGDNVVVDGGTLTGVVAVSIDGSTMSQNGTYQLTLQGFCGQTPCTCVIYLVVNCNNSNTSDLCGQAVVTCYGRPGEPSAALIDVRYNSTAPLGDDWLNPTTGPATTKTMFPNWDVSRLGAVFGIATDNQQNVYFAATDIYNLDDNWYGLLSYQGTAGGSGIYKADGSNLNNVTDLVATIPTNTPVVGTATLPNTGGLGNGLGNIAWDAIHNQLFVTNLEDGRIYRINPSTGIVLDAYDPFALDNGANDVAPADERLWGIGTYTTGGITKVYFSREEHPGMNNAVYSLTLTAGGGFPGAAAGGIYTGGGEVLEFECGVLPGLTCSVTPSGFIGLTMKYTDIEFSVSGKMLITARGFPHTARTHELVNIGGVWSVVKEVFTGLGSSNNSAGGVDYGYSDQNGDAMASCDSIIWNTANYMIADHVPGVLYGLEGVNATIGNAPSPSNDMTDIFADFNGTYSTADKTQIGDVDVFQCVICPIEPPCDANCLTNTLNISTGYDPATGGLIAPGNSDPLWTTIAVPTGAPVTPPMPANVVGPYYGAWANPSGSAWISAVPFNDYAINNCGSNDCSCPPFIYERCFCLCEESEITFDFDFLSDDAGAVELWDANNNVLVTTLANNCGDNTQPWNHQNPPVSVNQTVLLPKGKYCLRISHWNIGNVAMGVNLNGTVSGLNLLLDSCCANPNGSIVGTKFKDLDCDGVLDINTDGWTALDSMLIGWTFTLTDAANNVVGTATSDANGQFYFPNLPPGTYTVTETNQPNWMPSTPAGGTMTVVVTAQQVANVLFGNCELPVEPCDSINATILPDTTQSGCCYTLIINNELLNYFTGFQIDVLNGADLVVPPVPGSQWNLLGFSGFNNTASFSPAYGTYIDKGYSEAVHFCLKNATAPTQQLLINYYSSNGQIVCRETLTLECDNCVSTAVDSVYCETWNQPAAKLCITVGEGIEWPVNSVQFVPVGAGYHLSPECFSVSGLTGGQSDCFNANIIGALPGDTVCFTTIIHKQDVCAGEPDLQCCSGQDTICFVVPDCSPCPETIAFAYNVPTPGDSCCWNIVLNTGATNFFIGVNTEIITSGVQFTTIDNYFGSGWQTNILGNNEIYWDAIPPQGNYIQNVWQLPLVCFGEDGSGTPIPSTQEMVITWYGRDSSLCYDTLTFDCKLNRPDYDCAKIDSLSLACEQSAGDYTYSLQVTNYTNPPVQVDNISITQTSGAALIQQNDFPVSLPWGSSAVIQIPISGVPGDDVCFYVTLQRENANGQPIDCCSWPDSLPHCITLPDCPLAKNITARVAPNPSSGSFRIYTEEAVPPGSALVVYDLLGQVIHRQVLISGPLQHQVELKSCATGLYFMVIESDNWKLWQERVNIIRE
ncbi:MAG: HYR domain-containing protein, partial [Saprospiraceae bacterium]|nr:HYR domain-containing protein [Saprospiraceae bacterium]